MKMQTPGYSRIIIVLSIVLLSACNSMPDHARYIPKDAVVVAGINLKSLSKKIAWNVITGSKLFKEMQARIPEKNAKDAVSGIEKAGFDFANTFYVYVKSDNRFKGGNRITGLAPLADAAEWETYLKTVFPKVTVQQHGDIKEASLGKDMYVGWNKNLLIIINVLPAAPDYNSLTGGDNKAQEQPSLDMTTISAEMENAFKVTKENSIIGNKRFVSLEKEGHDLTFWLNYEQLVGQMSGSLAEKMSLSVTGEIWKDAAFATGVDFVKGKITGDMHYYVSDAMKEIGVEMGSTNADKDMIERMPGDNLDMMFAIHLSPKAIKLLLEKMNMLGLANLGLSTQGSNVDGVLDAFTGDMTFAMNDFSLKSEKVVDSFMGMAVVHNNQKPSMTMSYVVKINKKDNFQKLVKMVKDMGLQSMGSGFVIPLSASDSIYILMNDQYAIASNKYAYATGFLDGKYKSQKKSDAISSVVMGHPIAFFTDIQQFCKNIDGSITNSSQDSLMINESKKLLNNISLTGGSFSNNTFDYHMDINFLNTEENSIIALMDYGMKMSDANKAGSN